MALITYKIFKNTIDAHLLKSKLESEGVICYLFNEQMISMKPNYIDSDGGIKLKLNDFDLEKAQRIYLQLNPTIKNDVQPHNEVCVRCESHQSPKNYTFKQFIITFRALLSAVFAISTNKKNNCKICGAALAKNS